MSQLLVQFESKYCQLMRDYKKADADMLIQIAWQKYLSGVAASQDKGGLHVMKRDFLRLYAGADPKCFIDLKSCCCCLLEFNVSLSQ